jgi:SAM-dependent methyltransferase
MSIPAARVRKAKCLGNPPNLLESETESMRSSIPLYDRLASDYEDAFHDSPCKRVYDLLAWEHVCSLLPRHPAVIIDAGCGTGRWVDRLLRLGHHVVGIEQAPEMIKALERKRYTSQFTLVQGNMEQVATGTELADVVLAIGSLQYTEDPARMVRRFASWTKPGGTVCVVVDSCVALVLELIGSGKCEEALERLRTAKGVWKQRGQEADLHLLDRKTLESYFSEADLTDIVGKGLLVTASAWGLQKCREAIITDETTLGALERQLSQYAVMADAGKQILVTGRRVSPP